jgi:predicted phage terminase large subunit-like protein
MSSAKEAGSIFADRIKKAVAKRKKESGPTFIDESVQDFIVRMNVVPNASLPEHLQIKSPDHLGPALEQFNQIGKRPIRVLLSVPPRHGKSYTVMYMIAQYLMRNPTKRIAYITYGDKLSVEFSRKIRGFCQQAGVELSTNVKSAAHWETTAGGSVSAIGIHGTITGKGFDLVVIDDPHKDRVDTESETVRNNVFETCTSAGLSRLEPGGSCIVIHTRWHPDDLIGRLSQNAEEGWVQINIPAIDVEGNALWPARYPVEELRKIRARNEYDWASLYMGQPRPRGSNVFGENTPTAGFKTYIELPAKTPGGSAIGLDLAYTEKTYADYSVAISGIRYGDDLYITDMRRKQCEPKTFVQEIKSLQMSHPGSPIWWFIGGVEKGIVSLLRSFGVFVHAEVAKSDKFVRAQAVASSWNNCKVLIPENAPWASTFLSEVLSFTGVGDAHDDIVDALAALHHPLLGKRLPRAAGTKRIFPF